MSPEITVPFLWTFFEDRGYGGYLYYAKKNNHRTSLTPGANANEGTTEAIFAGYDEYIEKHGRRELHGEILEQCREADITNLSPQDLFVAGGHAIIAAANSIRTPIYASNTKHKLFNTFKIDI